MKTNQLTQGLSLSTLAFAGFAFAGCGAAEPADLGEGSEPMVNATAVETAPISTAQPDSVGTTTARAPDLYQLASGQLQVSYRPSDLDGQPHFTYQDGDRKLDFKAGDIRTSTSELGTLVTVSTQVTVDTGSTTFTLIVPNVSLDAGGSAPIATQGITTTHHFSLFRNADEGQTGFYTLTALSGTARASSSDRAGGD